MLDAIHSFLAHGVSMIGDNELAGLKILGGYIAIDAVVTMIFPQARAGAKFSLAYAQHFSVKLVGPFLALLILAYLSKNVDATIFGGLYALLYATVAADEAKGTLGKLRALAGLGSASVAPSASKAA